MLFLCLLDTATHFSLSGSQVWEPLEQTFYGPFCFMVDNGVIMCLSRRELKLIGKGTFTAAHCALSTHILLVTVQQKYSCHRQDELQDCPYHALQSPTADIQVLEGALKEAQAPVCGADRSGQHQEFQSGVPHPEAQAGGDSYMRKARVQ